MGFHFAVANTQWINSLETEITSTVKQTHPMFGIFHSVSCLYLLSCAGCLVRTVSVHPVRREFERLRWPCVCGTRFTIWSASSVPPARNTSVWVTATSSSTQTLCVSRTSSSGPNTTAAAAWFSRKSQSPAQSSVTLPSYLSQRGDCSLWPPGRHLHLNSMWGQKRLQLCTAPLHWMKTNKDQQ